ncbi:helix-turn-helix domain-containing protein [Streptomyces olivaceus]|uniref:helix-turn-helix domain-containing protein n=1 Tax=Streptomyces olivaceus TaxID=47716 RepID=UPI0004CB7873|nr:helix-turn-helix transcriptional regulator [Streptomyces olivaceus]MBZ6103175.1 helix-turn-helix domain-containing protein [Streptomyces olivaceus]MBZ6285747.1 helix-turn-helix domain-containing protein [Streptomyces olivaceus]
MSVSDEAAQAGTETDEPGWEVDQDDDWALAVITTVGRQLRLRREAAEMRVGDFAQAVGYGEDLVYKIESGKRIPRPEYLDMADEVLNAGGLIAAMKEDVKKVRYPKKVRDLAQMEARAVEIGVYECSSIAGLLQTPAYARALFEVRQPPYSVDEVDRLVAARMARLSIFDRSPAPSLSFVVEEAVLRRRVGGTMERKQQFERLLEVGRLNNVALQVMPLSSVAHPGMSGRIELLKFEDGTAVGRSDGAFNGRPTSDPRQLRILDLRYGTIRAQALPPGETLALIEKLLGET